MAYRRLNGYGSELLGMKGQGNMGGGASGGGPAQRRLPPQGAPGMNMPAPLPPGGSSLTADPEGAMNPGNMMSMLGGGQPQMGGTMDGMQQDDGDPMQQLLKLLGSR